MRTFKTVAALLRDKRRWTKGTTGETADGLVVGWDSPKAVRFCLVGAIRKVYGPRSNSIMETLRKHHLLNNSCGIINFNDAASTSHADVMRLVRKAKI